VERLDGIYYLLSHCINRGKWNRWRR